jgi:hypothetical protein
VVTAPHSILRAPVTGESEEGNLMIIIKKKKKCFIKTGGEFTHINFYI